MCMVFEWLYQNAVAIFISSIISLLISHRYYNKGNRDEVFITMIFPIVKLLEKPYIKSNYEILVELKSSYAIRYLNSKERKKLILLIDQYESVYKYDKFSIDTGCIMSYFEFKLREEEIVIKPCPIYDDERIVVAYDYPPEYNYLNEQIYDMVSTFEFLCYPRDYEKEIAKILNNYAKEFYRNEEMEFFNDYPIETVISKARLAKEWDEKLKEMEQRKLEFLNLHICKKVKEIIK